MHKAFIQKTTKHHKRNFSNYKGKLACSRIRRQYGEGTRSQAGVYISCKTNHIPAGLFVEIDELILKCTWK